MARHPDFPWMHVYTLDMEVLHRVVRWMNETGMPIDGESIGYGLPNGVVYPCTAEEFHELHGALDHTFDLAEFAEIDEDDGYFPQWEQHFLFLGMGFSWWMMTGQGTATQLAPAGKSRTPFCVENMIVISEDGNHVVPDPRVPPTGNTSREADETLVHLDDEDGVEKLNQLLRPHGVALACRSVRRDGGLYIKVVKEG